MKCRICGFVRARLRAAAAPTRAAIRKQSRAWEAAQSNEYELWSIASDQQRERLYAADAIQPMDPEEAFRIRLEVADEGVVWAMERVAHQYAWGPDTAPDFAKARAYYRRAIEAGSWMATLRYARLLADRGHLDAGEMLLRQGVEADFIPAFYWLAWCSFQHSKDRATCRAIKPLLERAASAGHSEATLFLARLKVWGKFGFWEIPRGFAEVKQIVSRTRAALFSDSGPFPAEA